jgi:hypothetical protein
MELKLSKLREGTVLVNPEERKMVQDMYSEKINQWRKRKRTFKELWDTITENMPKDLKEFKVLYLRLSSIMFVFTLEVFLTCSGSLFTGGAWH